VGVVGAQERTYFYAGSRESFGCEALADGTVAPLTRRQISAHPSAGKHSDFGARPGRRAARTGESGLSGPGVAGNSVRLAGPKALG